MKGKKEMQEVIDIMRELINASQPFISGDIVTETSGTIPLMDKLEDTIEKAESILERMEK